LVGRHTNSQIFNCYSTGLVTGTNLYIGGLAGWGSNPADDNNYWNIETSGQATSPIGEGRTTAEMTFPYAVNTYIDWDFEEIWAEDISGLINDGYPFLEWQLDYLRNIAFNPLPTDGSVNIPVTLQEMSWNYILFPVFSAPDGFRLYLNTTGNFSEDDDYAWIPYYENQIEYSCSEVLTELAYSTTYYWQVIPSTIDFYEASSDHDKIPRNDAQNCPVWNFTTEQDSSLDDTEIPLSTELIGNFPNPFNPETTIKFSLSQQGEVKLTIYNIKGRLVRTLLDEYRELGEHHVVWNGQDERGRVVPSGVYLYQLITERETISRKMMLLK